ncbi:Solute carrier family 15 member 1 [Lonchura striata]|uniref:Solute carrier family 15 member 1 n=1 Tax=Lonchura striata TaxID=40157 RepID=A0A218VA32_9PASE|nr:Solute carrier family 15 member 1 [Lonchura striata domestica]
MVRPGGKTTGKSVLCFGFPLSIFFIVINEFCERFSYYGMKTVLTLYFTRFLHWEDNFATAIYHTFVALCYLTPILGAMIADSWLGKFKTILYLSIVYAIGQIVLSVGSINDLTDHNHDGTPDTIAVNIALSIVGLVLIALGTGGIKPCVSAFGGDQFEDDQEKQRSTFFSLFYLSINAGSLLSTLVTPTIRASECGIHTKQECYPLAFGVPAILMAIALAGSKMYKKAKPQGNVMLEVSKCVGFAIKNRFQHLSKEFPKREHWLDWASEKYDKRLIAQIKMVLKVLFLYIPLPMFWAVFDQQGFKIQPDQMQIVNPILIVIMVPVVDSLVYPLIKKCKLNFTPLKKMTVGMFLGSMAFVAAALVQVQIDTGYMTFETSKLQSLNITSGTLNTTESLDLTEKQRYTFAFKWHPAKISYNLIEDNITAKPADGKSLVRFINNSNFTVNVTMGDMAFGELQPLSASNYSVISNPGWSYTINASMPNTCTVDSKEFGYGAAYTISLDDCVGKKLIITHFEDIAPNTVHMAWQIPQYFLLTCAEVLFSVTGLEFSYSQAPSNMKSVLQAGWLLTVAVGNIIVLIVAGASAIKKQWAEYVLFAALLLVVCVIFAIMASFYTYIDPNEIEAQFSKEEKEEKKARDGNEKEAETVSRL